VDRVFAGAGALAALLAVALGAFGAHALRSRLTPADLDIFETGVRYQMYHALALFGVAWASSRWPGGVTHAAGWAFLVGILIFSGSLYLLVVLGQRWLGAVTPLGGVAFLLGWTLLAWRILRG
jgi:uncharacterized membrane protein YgdD (TMEM256/DUF423 family)